MAKTGMPKFFTSEAATSSWVLSGLLAHSRISAPPAWSARIRFAVSEVTCRQAETRIPLRGCSRLNRSSMRRRTGMALRAHSIRRRPFSASARSFTS